MFILKYLGYILATLRAILCIITMAIYLLIYLFTVPFASDPLGYTDRWKRFWCRTACLILGIHLKVTNEGDKLPGTYLTVSNHISLMDPVVALTTLRGMPVAKAEISDYPLIGYAAKKTGIIWVEREELKSRTAAREAIRKGLEDGKSVLVYPEGTISYAPSKLRNFKKGAFDAAINAGVDIVFTAIYYDHPSAYWNSDRNLVQQYLKHFSALRHNVYLKISEPRHFSDAEQAAQTAQKWIQNALNEVSDAADQD